MTSRSKMHVLRAGLLLSLFIAPFGASAAETLPYGSFEVAPFIGYQLGGNFSDLQTGHVGETNRSSVLLPSARGSPRRMLVPTRSTTSNTSWSRLVRAYRQVASY